MKIGKIIKHLRREHDMTQESLAEKLNISVSAVSQWEIEKTMPDISMLPQLSAIFNVTTDELLGLKGEENERRVQEYLQKADDCYLSCRHREMLTIMEEAYENFPTNLDILDFYIFALDQNACKEHPEYSDKCIELAEIILDRSKNDKQRFRAINRAVKNYARLGDKESARYYAQMLPTVPHYCAPNVMRENNLFSDEEKIPHYQEGAENHLWLLCEYLFDIADPNYLNPCCTLTVEERVAILEQIIILTKTVYGDNLCAQYYRLYSFTRTIGALWLYDKKPELALDYFEKAYEYAVLFKTSYKDGDCYSSPAMKGVKAQPQSQWTNGENTAMQDLMIRFDIQKRYRVLNENPRFIALREKLEM